MASRVYMASDDLVRKVPEMVDRMDVAFRGKVAVKVHMGELGNVTHVRPVFVRRVVDKIKELGGEPFVIDTPAIYKGDRDTAGKYLKTAAVNGFTKESMGAEVVIDDTETLINGVGISKKIMDSDALFVVSHGKGHGMSGFGGAIKNVGMGCPSKNGKAVIHGVNKPTVLDCCIGCGDCAENCAVNAISIKNGKAVIDYELCEGCGGCMGCEQDAIHVSREKKEELQRVLARVTKSVLENFENVAYLNFLLDITKHCDCFGCYMESIAPNIGVIGSKDIVAIDKASIDLIGKHANLGEIHGVNPEVQIEEAVKIGLGSRDYELNRL